MMVSAHIIWWIGVSGTSDRGNGVAFRNIGVNAQLIQQFNPQVHLSQGADFVFTPMYQQMVVWNQMGFVQLPSVIQMGGYGLHFLRGGKIDRDVELVTEIPNSIVTVLDPKMMGEMKMSGQRFNYERMFVVPNGATVNLRNFPDMHVTKDSDEFIVFNPMGNFWVKDPQRFINCVEKVNELGKPIKFVFPIKTRHSYNCPIEWLDIPNLELLPMQNIMDMYKWYLRADVIGVYSMAEIFPTTVLEAMRFGKPIIHNNPSLIQTIPVELLDEAMHDFGMNVLDFDDAWNKQYFQGDHLLVPKDENEFADMILSLYDSKEEQERLGENAKRWFDVFYPMEAKCEVILKMLRERQLIE